MDIERARSFAQERAEFDKKIKRIEPENPNTELTPQERYYTLGDRIDGMSNKKEEVGGSIVNSVELNLGDGLSLSLLTLYDAVGSAYGREPRLASIAATWGTGKDQYRRSPLAHEQLFGVPSDSPESLRVLGLLEESVTVAENEVARRATENVPSQQV